MTLLAACEHGKPVPPRVAPPPPPAAQTLAPPPAPQAPAVAPPVAPIALAVDAAAPRSPSAPSAGSFGVRWRTAIPGAAPEWDETSGAIAIANEVFVSIANEIHVFDLATGAKLRSAKVDHTQLLAVGDALVARNDHEQFGLDKQTLRPTWRGPTQSMMAAVGDYVLETLSVSGADRLRLRRAVDGHVMWEISERIFNTLPVALADGDTLYVRTYVGSVAANVAAIDLATGAVRWRARGYLASANGGYVAIQDPSGPPPSYRIFDAAGRERWQARGAWLFVHGGVAYASASSGLAAIELASNRVLWRRAEALAFDNPALPFGSAASPGKAGLVDADDRWLYATNDKGVLQTIDRTTGELAGETQLGSTSTPLALQGAPVVRVGPWLFGLGPLAAPEPRTPVVARGCLVVTDCCGGAGLVGAKVTIAGTATAKTDRRGCFQVRAPLGLGPSRIEVVDAHGKPPTLDTDFPSTAVFDGRQVTLTASYIGGGCHDAPCRRSE